MIAAIFQINQTFASIYTVAASFAIGLWSISAFRNGGLLAALAIYGCVIAPVIILGICSGHLRLDVHGMAVVVFSQAIWFIAAGTQLWNDTRDTLPAFDNVSHIQSTSSTATSRQTVSVARWMRLL